MIDRMVPHFSIHPKRQVYNTVHEVRAWPCQSLIWQVYNTVHEVGAAAVSVTYMAGPQMVSPIMVSS